MTKGKANRKVQVVETDTHGGFRLALMNPATILFDEDEVGNLVPWQPAMTKSQEYLWKFRSQCIKDAFEIADGCEMLVLHLGDACQGNKYQQGWVSTRLSDQAVIADYNAQPWFEYKHLTHFRQVIGTQAHNAGEGSLELILVRYLQARFPKVDTQPLYHGLLEFGGVTTDYAHHGPHPGSRNWLKGNVARFYLRDFMQREIMNGKKPADLVLRGHYHMPVYELLEMKGHSSELMVLPSFSMFNDHATQATQSQNEITHGLVVFVFEDGKIVETHRMYSECDVRRVEVL
ncbi:MAG: hypothetical protein GYA45_11645 [Pelolinea sp.]|nr:hypothetical protein [Pelolinea sp.]